MIIFICRHLLPEHIVIYDNNYSNLTVFQTFLTKTMIVDEDVNQIYTLFFKHPICLVHLTVDGFSEMLTSESKLFYIYILLCIFVMVLLTALAIFSEVNLP